MKLSEVLAPHKAFLVRGAEFSQAVTISELGATFFFKWLFTPTQVFGRDVKIDELPRAEAKLTSAFIKRLGDTREFWIDDGNEEYLYKVIITKFIGVETEEMSAYEVRRDYQPGHENMLKRRQFELTALDPDTVDEDILEDTIKEHNLKLAFDGVMVQELINSFDRAASKHTAKLYKVPDEDNLMIDSILYELVVYEPEEKALYMMAHIEWHYKPKDSSGYKPGDMDDYTSARRKAGEPDERAPRRLVPHGHGRQRRLGADRA